MTVDVSRFSHGVRCRRLEKARTSVEGEYLHYQPGSVKSPRSYHKSQILLEDDSWFYVSPVKVVGSKTPLRTADATWDLGSAFVTALGKDLSVDTRVLGRRPVFDPISSSDFDKVLTVCTDMGRYDIAWRLVCIHLELPIVTPVSSVLWEKFPHRSAMILMTSENTAVCPTGMVKHVVESWWVLNGGYHGKHMYQIGPRDYSEFMNSIRNPYKVAAVRTQAITLGREYQAAYQSPGNMAKPTDGRKSWVYKGILYLADTDGTVLPYWYTNSKGARPEKIAWGSELRRDLATKLALPMSLARTLESRVGTDCDETS